MKTKKVIAAVMMTAAMAVAPLTVANADSFVNKVLTGAAGIYGVKLIAAPLNSFLDNLLLTNHIANEGKTKVVPILQTGTGTYVGAAQVSGPAYAVDRVQAVGSLAFEWNNNVWRGSILIPIDSLNPLKGFKRVYGVGVDAVINAKL